MEGSSTSLRATVLKYLLEGEGPEAIILWLESMRADFKSDLIDERIREVKEYIAMSKKADIVDVEAKLLVEVEQLVSACVSLLDLVFARLVRGGMAREYMPELERIHEENARVRQELDVLLAKRGADDLVVKADLPDAEEDWSKPDD